MGSRSRWFLVLLGVSGALLVATLTRRGELPGERVGELDAPESVEPLLAAADLRDVVAKPREEPTSLEVRRTVDAPASAAEQREACTGRVTDARDGSPVEGARVRVVVPGDEHDGEPAALSGADGSFSCELPGDGEVGIAVAHPAYAGAARYPVEDGDAIEFRLAPRGSIEGHVTWRGAGVPQDLTVSAWPVGTRSYGGEPTHEVTAEPDGTFTLPAVEPGEYAVGARAQGGPLSLLSGVLVRAGEASWAGLDVHPGVELWIRAVDAAEEPIAGVQVEVRADIQGARRSLEAIAAREGVTDGAGELVLGGIAHGPVAVTATTPSGARRSAKVVPDSVGRFELLELRFPSMGALEGFVLDAAGRPVGGAQVEVVRGVRGDEQPVATTSPEGRFHFDGLPGETRLTVVATSSAGGAGRSDDAPPRTAAWEGSLGEPPIELVLGESHPVVGRVVDTSGSPVAGAEVRVEYRVGQDWGAPWIRGTSTRTDELGSYALSAPQTEGFLRVEARGFEDRRVRFQSSATDGPVEADEIVLESVAELSAAFVDADGFAATDARLVVSLERDSYTAPEPDELGRFSLPHDVDRRHGLSVQSRRWRLAEGSPRTLAECGEPPWVFVLEPIPAEPRAVLVGEVRDAVTGDVVPRLRVHSLGEATIETSGVRFVASGVSPGERTVQVSANGYERLRLGTFEVLPGAELHVGRVELFPTGSLTVWLEDLAGQPVKNARVRLEPVARAAGGTGSDHGAVNVDHSRRNRYKATAPLGTWRLVVEAEGFADHEQHVEIEKKTTLTARLDPAPAQG